MYFKRSENIMQISLQDMSEGCQEAVQALAKCNGRERVDHIVAIHINAFTGNNHAINDHNLFSSAINAINDQNLMLS